MSRDRRDDQEAYRRACQLLDRDWGDEWETLPEAPPLVPKRPAIDRDQLWPRDLQHRYRVYAVRPGEEPEVLAAAPTAQGVGLALIQLHEDEKQVGRRLADRGRIGVLDVCPGGRPAPHGDWVVLPYDRGGE